MKFKLGEKVKFCNRAMYVWNINVFESGVVYYDLEGGPFYNCGDNFALAVPESAIQKLTTVYSVKHPGNNKVFNFKSNLELQNGDKVLCDTVFGIAPATVVWINNDFPATKWIISKLDTTEYDKAIEEERREREKEDIRTRIQIMEKELAAEKERLNQL